MVATFIIYGDDAYVRLSPCLLLLGKIEQIFYGRNGGRGKGILLLSITIFITQPRK